MKSKKRSGWFMLSILVTVLVMMACSLSSNPDSAPPVSPTPTPTPTVVAGQVEPPQDTSRCEGLSGAFEMQLLVGPSDAVGLEPFAVGEIPFSVDATGDSYTVQGANNISYQEVLIKEWGTYTVSFDMDITISGECGGSAGAEQLNVHVEMNGEQLVEVESEGFQGDYPWSGTHSQDLSFPLQEGASAEGQGWALVLHLNP